MSNTNEKIGNYRYRILGLLMFATTINYFDRSIIGVMAPTLEKMFDWTNSDYANIMVSFKVAYALGLLYMGGLIDRLGTKKGIYFINCHMECFWNVARPSSSGI